jgi:hypothetical protein
MLIVVGGARDAQIDRLIQRLGRDRAVRMDVRDLSAAGWRLESDRRGDGVVVAGGQALPASQVSGVLVRRLAVYPQELAHVHEEDRAYVAAELTALLMWWLTVLEVPVLNRPARGVLCGPFGRPEPWLALGAQLGLAVVSETRTRDLRPAPAAPRWTVSVVGDAAIGAAPRGVIADARRLARGAGATVLQAAFDDEGRLTAADSFPPLDEPVIDAIAARVWAPAPRALAAAS